MPRVRLSPQDFVRHLAGVQVVIDHELEVGVPTLIGTLAEWLRQRPFSHREILGHLRDASENPAAPAALNDTAATTRTTVGHNLTLPPNPHETGWTEMMSLSSARGIWLFRNRRPVSFSRPRQIHNRVGEVAEFSANRRRRQGTPQFGWHLSAHSFWFR